MDVYVENANGARYAHVKISFVPGELPADPKLRIEFGGLPDASGLLAGIDAWDTTRFTGSELVQLREDVEAYQLLLDGSEAAEYRLLAEILGFASFLGDTTVVFEGD